ncbi:MAG: class III extradiol ring-cleavage dioxygenase [Acidobacteriota bacterium]
MNFPAIFVSHGAPTLAIDDEAEAHQFLTSLGNSLGKPSAILVVSAHWQSEIPTVSLAAHPQTIHDFGGFPKKLYEIAYPAAGAVTLGNRVAHLLNGQGIHTAITENRGLDHGVWVPLMLMYPQANIPTTQLSLVANGTPEEHYQIGKVLGGLKDQGVMILASGGAVHNLHSLNSFDKPSPWAKKFEEFLHQKISEGNLQSLVNYRSLIAEGVLAHPTEEHLLPLFVAMGAGGFDENHPGMSIHRSWTYGNLSMASFQFNA